MLLITYCLLLTTYDLIITEKWILSRVSEDKNFENCIFSIFPYNENIRILSLSDHDEKMAGNEKGGTATDEYACD